MPVSSVQPAYQLIERSTQMAVSLLKHRQELLHLGRKSQRQLNVYKSIDSDR